MLAPRKILVVLQFSFAVILTISTIVVRKQLLHGQQRETGYQRDQLLRVPLEGNLETNYLALKQELLQQNIAVAVTKTMGTITERGSNTWGLSWQGKNPSFDDAIALYSTDADLVKTAGLKLVSGRDIDINQYPGDSTSVLLNETAVRTMGFSEPIGQKIGDKGSAAGWTVVGVVKDYVVGSPYAKVPPMMITGPGSWFSNLHIRLNPANMVSENITKAELVFKKINPSYPFNYKFIDQEYAKLFENEQRTRSLALLFTVLSVFISCLGLFGLSAYIAESRVKEIGIRKVLGASTLSIAELLSTYFIKLVSVAIIIAVPVSWYTMSAWLQEYNYRIDIGWEIYATAAFAALGLTLLTVSFQSLKAAMSNPVKNIRSN